MRGQTPQTFAYNLILKAHEKAIEQGISDASDDCRLVLALGEKVAVVEGEESNFKITSELDLFLAEQYLRRQTQKLPMAAFGNHPLQGKRYIIVGGTGGIGIKICDQLKEKGAKVLPLSRNSCPYAVDVRHSGDVEKAFKQILSREGEVDGIINCAGYLKVHPLRMQKVSEIYDQVAVNLLGVVWSCRFAPVVTGGHIVNVASSAYIKGRKDQAIYAASKAAVVNLTQALAEEHPEWHVNTLVPARTSTPMRFKNFIGDDPDELISPEEVAKEVVALLTSRGITGQIIEVRKSCKATS